MKNQKKLTRDESLSILVSSRIGATLLPDIGFKIDFPISMPDVFLSSARLILHSDPKLKIQFGNCWEKTGNILQSILSSL